MNMALALIVVSLLVSLLSLVSERKKFLLGTLVVLLVLAAGLEWQREREQEKEEAKSKYTGILELDSKVLLSPGEKHLPRFEIGSSGVIIQGDSVLQEIMRKAFNDYLLTISVKNGRLFLSTRVRDKTGSVVAELKDNEWKVGDPPKTWDRNYTKDALEVLDESGDVVLQVRLLSDRIQFQGKFYDENGYGVGFGVDKLHPDFPGLIVYKGPAVSELKLTIDPIFRYPSHLHFGELTG